MKEFREYYRDLQALSDRRAETVFANPCYMILLTLVLGTLIFVIRKGHGAKDADGRERPMGLSLL